MRASAAAADALAARRGARRICSAREIARALQRMADAITADLAGADPVVLAVMQGGAFAAVELCRRLRFPYELDFVHVTRYARSTRGGEIEWRVRPRPRLHAARPRRGAEEGRRRAATHRGARRKKGRECAR
jgi:hypoxanthine phosphoribosyltransferase